MHKKFGGGGMAPVPPGYDTVSGRKYSSGDGRSHGEIYIVSAFHLTIIELTMWLAVCVATDSYNG